MDGPRECDPTLLPERTETGVTAKPGRNQLCPCGSGAKYKFCCIGKELRPRIVAVDRPFDGVNAAGTVDLTNDVMNFASGLDRALHYFCKDNDFYLFSSTLTIGQVLKFSRDLKAGRLTRALLMQAYEESTKQHVVLAWIEDACANFPSFEPRKKILCDAINAHYQGAYTLSVPVLFAQIEGILRDIGALTPKDDLKPTIKRDWDSRTLFGMSDSAVMFNAFLHNLYQGQASGGDLNRNPVLHGTDLGYDALENSLILILTLLEIRTFLWFEKNTVPLV